MTDIQKREPILPLVKYTVDMKMIMQSQESFVGTVVIRLKQGTMFLTETQHKFSIYLSEDDINGNCIQVEKNDQNFVTVVGIVDEEKKALLTADQSAVLLILSEYFSEGMSSLLNIWRQSIAQGHVPKALIVHLGCKRYKRVSDPDLAKALLDASR